MNCRTDFIRTRGRGFHRYTTDRCRIICGALTVPQIGRNTVSIVGIVYSQVTLGLRPCPPHFTEVNHFGHWDELWKNHTTGYRRIEIRTCLRRQWRRPVITSCHIQKQCTFPGNRGFGIYTGHQFFGNTAGCLHRINRWLQWIIPRNFQPILRFAQDIVTLPIINVSTNKTIDIKITEFVIGRQDQVIV